MVEGEQYVLKVETGVGGCIFCDLPVLQNSVEHIVPESMGNKNYVLPNGSICRTCNNKFSKFEDKALTRTMLGFERARLGIPTKKGNAATAKSGNISWAGNNNFKKDFITVYGLTENDIDNFNEKDGSFRVTIKDFDKSEMATSKLLLKIGYEALYASQKMTFNKYNFANLKDHLTNKNNKDWPFLSTTDLKLSIFNSVPRFTDKHQLKKIKSHLLVSEINSNTLLFSFK